MPTFPPGHPHHSHTFVCVISIVLYFSFSYFRMCDKYISMQSLSPTLWRTCRVIANDSRLNLLRVLFEYGENTVTALGKRTGLAEPHVSLHLRLLNSRGLITARHDGKWVYYTAMPNRAVKHAPEIMDALEKTVADTGMKNRHVLKIATAFTHERRIVIVRHLQPGSTSARALSLRTQIPLMTLYRHLDKLVARRIVKSENHLYALGKPSKLLGETLLSIAATPLTTGPF